MRGKPDYYDVEDLRLFLSESHFEVRTTGRELAPSPMHRSLLLTLARHSPEVVAYSDLWKEVWRGRFEMSEDDRAKIQTTKGQLIAWLKAQSIENLLIEPEPGLGYRLNNIVTRGWFEADRGEIAGGEILIQTAASGKRAADERADESITDDLRAGHELPNALPPLPDLPINRTPVMTGGGGGDEVKEFRQLVFSHAFYITFVALGYGSLFMTTAFLETAYDFDSLGGQAIRCGLITMLINTAGIGAAAALIAARLFNGKAGLLWGIGILFGAALFSIAVAAQFLPVEPITKAAFQTQPALIAFAKNALIYFFPLAAFFILLSFYTVSVKRLLRARILEKPPFDHIEIEPHWFLIVCLGMMIFSFVSTNYLLDHLNPAYRYYPLYTGLIFLRMFVYFGLALTAVAWYYANTIKQTN